MILNLIQFLCLRAVKHRDGADMRLHAVHNMSGSHNLRLGAKTQHPRKELRADHTSVRTVKWAGPSGTMNTSAAQPVQNGTYQVIFKPHLYL